MFIESASLFSTREGCSMNVKEAIERRNRAAAELFAREHLHNEKMIVNRLGDGLTSLRNLLFARIHEDVEANFGSDSMIIPVSERKMEERVKGEIEVYQVAVAVEEAADRRYFRQDPEDFAHWLCGLRLGEGYEETHYARRLEHYLSLPRIERRVDFTGVLARALPEAARAPLILFRLYPLAIRIVTNLAFDDTLSAAEWRNQQIEWQPAIADCHECLGRPLDVDEVCTVCSNPVWAYRWLTVAE
jgi:hypothetical protein